jgi:predicted nuclease with TOPRIM domain
MSTDRTTEILNYLTAISRDVGELRAEVKQLSAQFTQLEARFEQMEARFGRMEREQRQHGQRFDRMAGTVLTMRADIEELQDRVAELEGKQA